MFTPALRARIILAAAEGTPNNAIAAKLLTSRPTVLLWRQRFARVGVPGIMKDAKRPERKKQISEELVQQVVETFKLSKDPKFVEKLRDVVALYLDPPEKALVLSVDEKSQIQALERTRPLMPLRLGIPARQIHDYHRHGTTTLFAELSMLDGKVIGGMPCNYQKDHLAGFFRSDHQSLDGSRFVDTRTV